MSTKKSESIGSSSNKKNEHTKIIIVIDNTSLQK